MCVCVCVCVCVSAKMNKLLSIKLSNSPALRLVRFASGSACRMSLVLEADTTAESIVSLLPTHRQIITCRRNHSFDLLSLQLSI